MFVILGEVRSEVINAAKRGWQISLYIFHVSINQSVKIWKGFMSIGINGTREGHLINNRCIGMNGARSINFLKGFFCLKMDKGYKKVLVCFIVKFITYYTYNVEAKFNLFLSIESDENIKIH